MKDRHRRYVRPYEPPVELVTDFISRFNLRSPFVSMSTFYKSKSVQRGVRVGATAPDIQQGASNDDFLKIGVSKCLKIRVNA